MAGIPVKQNLDLESIAKVINSPSAVDPGDLVPLSQLLELIENNNWKDEVRAAATGNVNISNPGTDTFDDVTLTSGQRLLVGAAGVQTDPAEAGIYIFNGSSVPLTRAPDASTFEELHGAIVTVLEGTTYGQTTWRQTQLDGVIDTDDIIWVSWDPNTPDATDSVKGKVRLATQSEVNAGDAGGDPAVVTPETLADWSGRVRVHAADIGDNSSTSLVVTHNFNNRDVTAVVRLNSGNYEEVFCEKRFALDSVTFVFAAAPTSNQLRAIITGIDNTP